MIIIQMLLNEINSLELETELLMNTIYKNKKYNNYNDFLRVDKDTPYRELKQYIGQLKYKNKKLKELLIDN